MCKLTSVADAASSLALFSKATAGATAPALTNSSVALSQLLAARQRTAAALPATSQETANKCKQFCTKIVPRLCCRSLSVWHQKCAKHFVKAMDDHALKANTAGFCVYCEKTPNLSITSAFAFVHNTTCSVLDVTSCRLETGKGQPKLET